MYERSFPGWLAWRADMRHCRVLLQHGSRSFFTAAQLLPARYRVPATALYAFCRVADDDVDEGEVSARATERLRRRLDRVYGTAGTSGPVERAFADVVRAYRIPRAVPDALIEGFDWDLDNRRYRTLGDTCAYAARVAGTVGTMMAMIMGVTSRRVLSRALDLGVAMQLTNIARDVGEDAMNGRVYLPLERLHAKGIDVDRWLAVPAFTPGLGAVVKEVLQEAERLYRRAETGIAQLPGACRPSMYAARFIYADIGRVIAANGHDSVSQRAVVPARRKVQLLGRALRSAARHADFDDAPALAEARFLLDALPRSA